MGRTEQDEPSENEERLRFVANAVPALLAYLDIGARYVWANETYRRWFGQAPDEVCAGATSARCWARRPGSSSARTSNAR